MTPMSNPIARALADAEAARAKARAEALERVERVAVQLRADFGAVHAFPSLGAARAGGLYTTDAALADADGQRFELYLCVSSPGADGRTFSVRLLFETWQGRGKALARLGGVEIDASGIMNWPELLVRDALAAAAEAIRRAPPGPIESAPDARDIVFGYLPPEPASLHHAAEPERADARDRGRGF